MSKKKMFFVFGIVALFCATPTRLWADVDLDKPLKTATDGNGKLYETGEFRVAVLNGTYRAMGKQYGELMADDINVVATMTSLALTQLVGAERAEKGKELMRSQIDLYPKRFRDILEGMAEGSGLSIEEIALADHVISLFAAVQEGLFCSSITVWGDYTTYGQLIMGRNFDYPALYKTLSPQLCVVVFNPTDGGVPTALFGYAGQISSVQAFNRDGLVLELNIAVGLSSPNNAVQKDRITMPLLLTQLAFDCSTMAQLDAGLKTMRTNFPLLSTVADKKTACTYEMGTRDTVKRAIDCEGLNTVTNFVCDASWGKDMLSDRRQGNLQQLANQNRKKIDYEEMKQIIGTKINAGGAMVLENQSMIVTLYQFVFEPGTMRLAVRIPSETEDWTDIDLALFFAP